jgi:hypothetical protein
MIVFLCPPADRINGGIKYIFRMAEALIAAGLPAAVLEQNKKRPVWFPSTAPMVGKEALQDSALRAIMLPEDQPEILKSFATHPARKVVYCQNHFYAAYGTGDAPSYRSFGVTDVLCASQTILEWCQQRHRDVRAHLVPCSVDTALFKPAPKQKTIAFLPRKRMIESIFIRDQFRLQYPAHHDWQWLALDNKSESEVAAAMGTAEIFLALNRLDGFGLTPLEAMAADCVVAGFTGVGGREYATPQNGFWVAEDDFPAAVTALAQAIALAGAAERAAYRQACQQTLSCYTPAIFTAAAQQAWHEIMKNTN